MMHNTESAIPYYYFNLFADTTRDVQGFRKGMVGELFIMFFLYVANVARNHYLNPPSPQSFYYFFNLSVFIEKIGNKPVGKSK